MQKTRELLPVTRNACRKPIEPTLCIREAGHSHNCASASDGYVLLLIAAIREAVAGDLTRAKALVDNGALDFHEKGIFGDIQEATL